MNSARARGTGATCVARRNPWVTTAVRAYRHHFGTGGAVRDAEGAIDEDKGARDAQSGRELVSACEARYSGRTSSCPGVWRRWRVTNVNCRPSCGDIWEFTYTLPWRPVATSRRGWSEHGPKSEDKGATQYGQTAYPGYEEVQGAKGEARTSRTESHQRMTVQSNRSTSALGTLSRREDIKPQAAAGERSHSTSSKARTMKRWRVGRPPRSREPSGDEVGEVPKEQEEARSREAMLSPSRERTRRTGLRTTTGAHRAVCEGRKERLADVYERQRPKARKLPIKKNRKKVKDTMQLRNGPHHCGEVRAPLVSERFGASLEARIGIRRIGVGAGRASTGSNSDDPGQQLISFQNGSRAAGYCGAQGTR
ncbi:hypothetical protein PENSPDRAFT_733513 [Peniophora sp. CONT]|nr:hypothetical protein PENSPDRAFT_733513 [Peniophora sp. CONT]